MKFDLTFLLHSNEKAPFEDELNCTMEKSVSSSLGSNPVSQSDDTEGGNDHSILATSMGTTRSTSIPLPASHVPKTKSELQLCIDEEAAEQRDARMFYRLVNGIRDRQQQHTEALTSVPFPHSLEQSISRIVQARLAPLGEAVEPVMGQVSQPHDFTTEHIEFPQEASDSWSISGYDQEDQTPLRPYCSDPEEQEEKAYPEEEGLFEMDL